MDNPSRLNQLLCQCAGKTNRRHGAARRGKKNTYTHLDEYSSVTAEKVPFAAADDIFDRCSFSLSRAAVDDANKFSQA
jgi:hypothetical protein